MENIHTPSVNVSLKQLVEQAVGVEIQTCYQCGKCTAGCPLNNEMDLMPNQILRMLQAEFTGYENEILTSISIWLCLACDTCYSRCPQEVKLPNIMDFLRQESIRRNLVNPKAKNILKFHRAFLDEVERNGKLNELGLTIDYKLRSWDLFQDLQNAPSMLLKGKLGLIPHRVQNPNEIKKLFKKING
jgi:heterodisulfide reductase subunit C2